MRRATKYCCSIPGTTASRASPSACNRAAWSTPCTSSPTAARDSCCWGTSGWTPPTWTAARLTWRAGRQGWPRAPTCCCTVATWRQTAAGRTSCSACRSTPAPTSPPATTLPVQPNSAATGSWNTGSAKLRPTSLRYYRRSGTACSPRSLSTATWIAWTSTPGTTWQRTPPATPPCAPRLWRPTRWAAAISLCWGPGTTR